jgi:hypothetical protein
MRCMRGRERQRGAGVADVSKCLYEREREREREVCSCEKGVCTGKLEREGFCRCEFRVWVSQEVLFSSTFLWFFQCSLTPCLPSY